MYWLDESTFEIVNGNHQCGAHEGKDRPDPMVVCDGVVLVPKAWAAYTCVCVCFINAKRYIQILEREQWEVKSTEKERNRS